jgi:hypothetical protein
MARNEWRKLRVVVEIPVYNDCISETDLRWCVQTALTSKRALDRVIRERHENPPYTKVKLGTLMVKMWSRVYASLPIRTEKVEIERRVPMQSGKDPWF